MTSSGRVIQPGQKGDKGDPGGLVKGTLITALVDLDTLYADGLYYSNATSRPNALTLHYPHANMTAGVLKVSGWYRDNIDVIQTWETSNVVGGMTNMVYRRTAFNNVWTAWKALLPARVDQTAGRAIYQWDDVNNREQLVYGDTGNRRLEVTDTLQNGWNIAQFHLRRQLYTVTMGIYLLGGGSATATTFYTIPTGFRPSYGSQNFPIRAAGISTDWMIVSSVGDCQLPIGVSYSSVAVQTFSWSTNDAWPATLPGTASGSIPAI